MGDVLPWIHSKPSNLFSELWCSICKWRLRGLFCRCLLGHGIIMSSLPSSLETTPCWGKATPLCSTNWQRDWTFTWSPRSVQLFILFLYTAHLFHLILPVCLPVYSFVPLPCPSLSLSLWPELTGLSGCLFCSLTLPKSFSFSFTLTHRSVCLFIFFSYSAHLFASHPSSSSKPLSLHAHICTHSSKVPVL